MIEPQAEANIPAHLSGYMYIPAFMIIRARKVENMNHPIAQHQ